MSYDFFQSDLFAGIVSATFAASIAIWGNSWLSKSNRQKEERIRFLTDAYLDLEFGTPRDKKDGSRFPYSSEELVEMDTRFNSAMIKINLFGTPEQVNLCRELPKHMNTDYTELSLNLRDSLREEIKLQKLTVGHFWFVRHLSTTRKEV